MRVSFIFLFCVSCIFLTAQDKYGHNWVLLNFNHIDFNTTPPTLTWDIPEPLGNNVGLYSTSMSNKTGKLIFMTAGCEIFNKDYVQMENGDSINSTFVLENWCGGSGDFPANQGVTIFPKPNIDNQFFVVNNDLELISNPLSLPLSKHLFYHTIDMDLGNGLGSVIAKKQIAIRDTLMPGNLQATLHKNGEDWWVVAPKWNSSCYFITRFTENGSTSPLKICLEEVWTDYAGFTNQAVFSPNGRFYARTKRDSVFIYEFNNETGVLFNERKLIYPEGVFAYRGVGFSPNSRFLYISTGLHLYQFDVLESNMQNSRVLVGEIPEEDLVDGEKGIIALQKLAPNGRIYLTSPFNHKYLSTVNRPNCKGLLSDFNPHSLEMFFNPGDGLPNLPHFNVLDIETECDSISSTQNILAEEVFAIISPNPATSYLSIKSPVKDLEYQLLDVLGRVLQEGEIEREQINISAIPSGMYYLLLVDKKTHRQQVEKLLIGQE